MEGNHAHDALPIGHQPYEGTYSDESDRIVIVVPHMMCTRIDD